MLHHRIISCTHRAMTEFVRQTLKAARALKEKNVSDPIAVAGLADTVRDAIAGMARARAAAKRLADGSQRLVGNIAAVDGVTSQLDAANEQLEGAIAAVGSPLDVSSSSGNDSANTSHDSASVKVTSEQAQTSDVTDPNSVKQGDQQPVQAPHGSASDGAVVEPTTGQAPSQSTTSIDAATPEEGIKKSLAHVEGANK